MNTSSTSSTNIQWVTNIPKRIYVGGTFDLFHPGHVKLFMKAKKIADQVVVSVNTDEFVLRYKGKAPAYTLEERMELVRACKYVDQVVINEGDEDSTVAILKTRPNFILHSAEWSGEALMEQMGISQKFLDDYNILMVYVDRTPDISSTDLRARIIKA